MWIPTLEQPSEHQREEISTHGIRVDPDRDRARRWHRPSISTHGIRVDPDTRERFPGVFGLNFNPRDPCGSRRFPTPCSHPLYVISTHGIRVDPDWRTAHGTRSAYYFNPRDPCGSRRRSAYIDDGDLISTHGIRVDPDVRRVVRDVVRVISTHGIRVDPDHRYCGSRCFGGYFNPRDPCGSRLAALPCCRLLKNFNPRDPCGSRPAFPSASLHRHQFQPTGSVWIPTLDDGGDAKPKSISTHGIRVDPDRVGSTLCLPTVEISTHGIRVDPDPRRSGSPRRIRGFQPTGSVWIPTATLCYRCSRTYNILNSFYLKRYLGAKTDQKTPRNRCEPPEWTMIAPASHRDNSLSDRHFLLCQ